MKYANLIRFKPDKKELSEILSPDNSSKNVQLFGYDAKDQNRFSNSLQEKGMETIGLLSDEVNESISKIKIEIQSIIDKYSRISDNPKSRAKLDFDIAKIVHSNLNFSKTIGSNYHFWRWLTLDNFVEEVLWRWVTNPDDIKNKLHSNAKTVYRRAFGDRDRRIDMLRYWVIGERLVCKNKGYYHLDRLADLARNYTGPFQDFINNIIDNSLLSPNNNVVKIMAELMLSEKVMFTTTSLINSFKRYHVFKTRLLIDADVEIFEKEICINS